MKGKKKRKNPEHCHKLVEIKFPNESHFNQHYKYLYG